jgi:hypothetical protein
MVNQGTYVGTIAGNRTIFVLLSTGKTTKPVLSHGLCNLLYIRVNAYLNVSLLIPPFAIALFTLNSIGCPTTVVFSENGILMPVLISR